MTLTEFVTARLAEKAAEADDFHDARRCGSLDRDGGFELRWCDCGYPARVRRMVEAGRLLLAELAGAKLAYEQARSVCIDTRDRAEVAKYDATVNAAYAAWRSLQRVAFAQAAAWSDHPDYSPDWAA